MSLLSSFDRVYPPSSCLPLTELQLPSEAPDLDHHLTRLPFSPLSAAAATFGSHDYHSLQHSTQTDPHQASNASSPPFSDSCSGYSSSSASDASSYADSPPRFSFDDAGAAIGPVGAFSASAPSAAAVHVTASTARARGQIQTAHAHAQAHPGLSSAAGKAASVTTPITTTTDGSSYYSTYDSDYCPSTRSTSPASSFVHASPKLEQQAFAAANGFDSPQARHAQNAQAESESSFASMNQSAPMPYYTDAQQQQLQQGAPMYQQASASPFAYANSSSPVYLQQTPALQQHQQYYYNQTIQRQQQQQQQAQRHMYAQQQQAQMSHMQHQHQQQQHLVPQQTPVAVAPAFETASGTYYFVPSTAIIPSVAQAAEPWSAMPEQIQPRQMMSQAQQQQQQHEAMRQAHQLPARQISPVVSAPVASLGRADSPLVAPLARVPVHDYTISGLTKAASTLSASRSQSNSPVVHSEVDELLPTQSDAPPSPKAKTAKATTTKASSKTRTAKRGGRRGAFYGESTGKSETKRFVCPYEDCGRAFSRNFNMQSHLKSHLNIRDFNCPCCPKKFSRRHDRARHCAAVHDMHNLADNIDHQSTSKSSQRRSSLASSGDDESDEFEDDKADSTYRG
ncbi:BZ3500_MvSof-1268-A1-R1_Chr8-1g09747 [Microbotryum saponariae]|uniref:BZ3500_MvSof-1268-A1-R1_Chr8-1g09747 protein n=1 Tax=Microbotryum saponariae TaxID=289078 RepID=A0A2X0LI14_9BASI|nr:BZ3500_MvSof-1268-A1-R1_Chr8-1g09747 [Microbotryum saponariae]SDA08033.1 BZ3501_MvSof-1269-A2-R1_Chr8-1g09470 [Microbotryum saponariae]